MSLHDAYRAFRDFFHQVRDSLKQARTANAQIPGTWPTGTEQSPDYQLTGASSQRRQRLPYSPSNLPPDALQSLPIQYRQQQTLTGGYGPQPVATRLDPANFWGDLVILPPPSSPFAGQWQASHSLALLVDAIYHWAESTLPPFNEGGLSPQKVGWLLSMGDLSHNIQNVPSTSRSVFGSSAFTAPAPLLTREGYLRFILIGILIDPTTNFVNFNTFLSKIHPLMNPMTGGILPSSIPRYAFPATEDSKTKRYFTYV
ncbi:hypothetical protein FANTH_13671 [Fusarium anthophilum]|uniref:DUF7514 domain-containing protein n=1 Tax=Fusarium anthophilum TaxID=48485 RepID=A0A8H4YN03_9HYPO|nr:hypothetical protein FANTH_13671 [Fusarium anthophilum]